MSYCKQCGNKLTDGVKYCTACGARVTIDLQYEDSIDKKSENRQEIADSAQNTDEDCSADMSLKENNIKKKTKCRLFVLLAVVLVIISIGIFIAREIVIYSNVWGKWERISVFQFLDGSTTDGIPIYLNMRTTLVFGKNRTGSIEYSLVESDSEFRGVIETLSKKYLINQLEQQGLTYEKFIRASEKNQLIFEESLQGMVDDIMASGYNFQVINDTLKAESRSFKYKIEDNTIIWDGVKMGDYRLEEGRIVFENGNINYLYDVFSGKEWEHYVSFDKID